jgi:hypothetical protein
MTHDGGDVRIHILAVVGTVDETGKSLAKKRNAGD